MAMQMPLRAQEVTNFEFFLGLPEVDRTKVKVDVAIFCDVDKDGFRTGIKDGVGSG